MKRRGFTLVELLAVIVILAIVSLISVPLILGVIEKVNMSAAQTSANAYSEALTQVITTNEMKGTNQIKSNNTYYVTRGTTIDGKYYEALNDIVKIKGYKPTGYDDYIKFGKNYIIEEAILTINGYEIKIQNNDITTIEKGQIIELDYITVKETETMERGSSYTIETIFEPINTSDQRIKYESSNKNIITVDDNGLVTAVKNGEAIVTVTPLSNKNLKKEIKITVISPSEVTSIKLNKESTTIGLGKSEDLIVTLEPSDATSNALTWESNNESVRVSDSGKITGVSLGSATVTATTQNGLKASIDVTVEHEVTLNGSKYYTSNDSVIINDIDVSNKTNISCNNGSIPKYENNSLLITNINSSIECLINDSLKTTIDNIDSSVNNILMVNDETLNNQEIIIEENNNVVIDINGKTIISTFDKDTASISNNGNLTFKDSLNTGLVKTNYRLIKSFGTLNIESGNYKRENADSGDGGVIHIEDGEAILKNSKIEADITWAIFTYDESKNENAMPIIRLENCNISTNSGVSITNYNSKGKIYLNNSNITNGNIGILNHGELVQVDNSNFKNLTTAIRSEKGLVNINKSNMDTTGVTIRNYLGEVNITSGIFKSTSTVIDNFSSGKLNINDTTGKVYLSSGSSSGIIYNGENKETDLSNIIINGHRASKTTNGVTVYDDLACTSNPNDMDSGICLYSGRSGITTHYGNIDISGLTVVSKNISIYQLRSGKSYIKNAYIKSFGSTCDASDQALCDAIRNHYTNSYVEIENSEIINEHGLSVHLCSNNNAKITNTNITSVGESAIATSASANLVFDGGTVSSNADMIARLSGTGTFTIKNGNFTSNNDSNAIGLYNGTLIIEGGKFHSENANTVALYGGNAYVSGGDFSTNTTINFRATLENSGTGNIYVNGGTFNATNGGAAFKIQGKDTNGNIYLCDANINSTFDLYNIEKLSGTLYYSNNVKFTNGTNTPKINDGALISSNYSGTCTRG